MCYIRAKYEMPLKWVQMKISEKKQKTNLSHAPTVLQPKNNFSMSVAYAHPQLDIHQSENRETSFQGCRKLSLHQGVVQYVVI